MKMKMIITTTKKAIIQHSTSNGTINYNSFLLLIVKEVFPECRRNTFSILF